MLVEVTGLSSAGKSTLLDQLIVAPPPVEFDVVWLGTDRALSPFGLQSLGGVKRRAVLTALGGFGWLGAGRSALSLARTLSRAHRASCLPPRSWARWNGTMNAAMQLGLLLLLRRTVDDRELVLLDTGPVHTVYNFFVDTQNTPIEGAVAHYLSALPMADRVVWLDQDREVIVDRTLGRKHRRVRHLDRDQAEAFHDHGLLAMSERADVPTLSCRLVAIDLAATQPLPDEFFRLVTTASTAPVDQ